ncbi:hypothetical protein GOODEAATRI_025207 [Goodea atripinnis]|uniref:Uncharacterized protein n=1 Tax=Goodea atripinnis TaxID=208336 RepID=A0ABV0N487_9TELE
MDRAENIAIPVENKTSKYLRLRQRFDVQWDSARLKHRSSQRLFIQSNRASAILQKKSTRHWGGGSKDQHYNAMLRVRYDDDNIILVDTPNYKAVFKFSYAIRLSLHPNRATTGFS